MPLRKHVHKFEYTRISDGIHRYKLCRCRARKNKNGTILEARRVPEDLYYGRRPIYFGRSYIQ